jgi:hypothetical protein
MRFVSSLSREGTIRWPSGTGRSRPRLLSDSMSPGCFNARLAHLRSHMLSADAQMAFSDAGLFPRDKELFDECIPLGVG